MGRDVLKKAWLREEQRMDAAIGRALVRHMSNAKWRKVFAVLTERSVGPVRFKLLRDERVGTRGPQERAGATTLGDELPAPCLPYRWIEWIETPLARAEEVERALAAVGRFPLRRTETGLRVVGYER